MAVRVSRGEATTARAATRSGWRAASAAAYAPPTDIPTRPTRSASSRSSTAMASSATDDIVESAGVDVP
jgi:hypothetical protein